MNYIMPWQLLTPRFILAVIELFIYLFPQFVKRVPTENEKKKKNNLTRLKNEADLEYFTEWVFVQVKAL